MRYLDKKFANHWKHYIIQCSLATGVIFFIMMSLDVFFEMTIIASVGATTFIVFTMPHTERSRWRYIIGGYIFGLLTGLMCYYASQYFSMVPLQVTSALAVGITMFIMVVTNTEHPPAAAFALAISINGTTESEILFILSVTSGLIGIKYLFGRYMIDLL